MKHLSVFLRFFLFFATVMSACNREPLVDQKPNADQRTVLGRVKPLKAKLQELLVTGLGGGWGSTVGPGGDLFVPDGKAGTILRVDPKTGDYTTFASGLPKLIPEVGIGAVGAHR